MFAIVICLVLLMCTMTISSFVLCILLVVGMSVVVNAMLFLFFQVWFISVWSFCLEIAEFPDGVHWSAP